jgi:hypothetical protein
VDSAIAVKRLLRYRSIAVTQQHSIKVDLDAKRAMDKISALFDNTAAGLPN